MKLSATIIPQEVKTLAGIFEKENFAIRLAGGAVRDSILGKIPKDFDLATTATPDEMMALAKKYNLTVIPTGIEHGTLTFHIDGENYEVTTLRIDAETNGRHASVEWTRDWKVDASRRDLSINAMFMDMDGNVYDYFNGVEDLKNGVVRFVGETNDNYTNAVTRINEDYLRSLRWFRFIGRQMSPKIDNDILRAIEDTAEGLKQISGERIWMELSKILIGNNVETILNLMNVTGVADVIGLKVTNPVFAKKVGDITDNPVTVLVTQFNNDQKGFEAVVEKWKMSNVEKNLGLFILNYAPKYTMLTKSNCRDIIIGGAKADFVEELAAFKLQPSLINDIKGMSVPVFPVTGGDLINIGVPTGPAMGRLLNTLKTRWIASLDNIPLSKEDLLKDI